MGNAIFCVAIGHGNKMYDLSIKSIEQYAKRIGVDFIVHTKPHFDINWEVSEEFKKKQKARYAWVEKLYAIKLLEQYDRVLLLDTDILIMPNAPNIFSKYPDDHKNYVVSETLHDSRPEVDGYQDILRLEHTLGDVKHWPKQNGLKRYFNSGVVLFSKNSNIQSYFSLEDVKTLFNKIIYLDQTYLNYLFFKNNIQAGELDPRYNWISFLHDKRSRDNAYFVHHAVRGYGRSSSLKTQQFIHDYSRHYYTPWKHKIGCVFRTPPTIYLLIKHNLKKFFGRS